MSSGVKIARTTLRFRRHELTTAIKGDAWNFFER